MARFSAFTRGVEIATSFHNGNISWSVEAVKRLPVKRRVPVVKYMQEWMKLDYDEFARFERAFRNKYPRATLLPTR